MAAVLGITIFCVGHSFALSPMAKNKWLVHFKCHEITWQSKIKSKGNKLPLKPLIYVFRQRNHPFVGTGGINGPFVHVHGDAPLGTYTCHLTKRVLLSRFVKGNLSVGTHFKKYYVAWILMGLRRL